MSVGKDIEKGRVAGSRTWEAGGHRCLGCQGSWTSAHVCIHERLTVQLQEQFTDQPHPAPSCRSAPPGAPQHPSKQMPWSGLRSRDGMTRAWHDMTQQTGQTSKNQSRPLLSGSPNPPQHPARFAHPQTSRPGAPAASGERSTIRETVRMPPVSCSLGQMHATPLQPLHTPLMSHPSCTAHAGLPGARSCGWP